MDSSIRQLAQRLEATTRTVRGLGRRRSERDKGQRDFEEEVRKNEQPTTHREEDKKAPESDTRAKARRTRATDGETGSRLDLIG